MSDERNGITVKANSVIGFASTVQGKIKTIEIAVDQAFPGNNYFTRYAQTDCLDYNGVSGTIRANNKTIEISDNTVIMVAPEITDPSSVKMGNYCVASPSELGNEDIYIQDIPVHVFDVDNLMTAGLVVIGGFIDREGEAAGMAMLEHELYSNGKYKMAFLQYGQRQALPAFHALEGTCLRGDVLIPHKNILGSVVSIDRLATVSDGALIPCEGLENNGNVSYALGTVTGKTGRAVTLDEGNPINIPLSANIYIYEDMQGTVKTGTLDDFNVSSNSVDGYTYSTSFGDNILSVGMVIRFYSGIAEDIAIYLFGECASDTGINLGVTESFAYTGFKYNNTENKEINPVLVMARYNGGKMADMMTKRITIAANSEGIVNGMLPGMFNNGEHVKAMLLDNWNNAKPLLNTSRVDVAGLPDKKDPDYLRILSVDINSVGQINDLITITYGESGLAVLSQNVSIYKNGLQVGSDVSVLEIFYGELELSGKNESGEYCAAYISDYSNIVVDSVNAMTGKVKPKAGKVVAFENDSTFASLYDSDGKKLDWSDLKKYDIISTKIIYKNNMTAVISKLSKNTVTGEITAKTGDNKFKIGDNYYRTDNQNIFDGDLKIGDKGLFFLDIFGNIAHYEPDLPLKGNYAYVLDSAVSDHGFEKRFQLKAFTGNNEVITFTCARDMALVRGTNITYYTNAEDLYDLESIIRPDTVIKYDLNYYGEINKIELPQNEPGTGHSYFAKYAQSDYFNYNSDTKTLTINETAVKLCSNTVIMIAPEAGEGYWEDDYAIIPFDELNNNIHEAAKTQVFNVNENMEAGLVVIGAVINFINADPAMVTKVSQTYNDEGAFISRLTVFQGGETNCYDLCEGVDPPNLFSVIKPRINTKGKIMDYDIIINFDNGCISPGEGFENSGDTEEYFFGTVTNRKNDKITILDCIDNEENLFSIRPSANIYLYDDRIIGSKPKTRICDDINVFEKLAGEEEYYDEFGDLIDSVHALVHYHEGILQNVVIYFNTDFSM